MSLAAGVCWTLLTGFVSLAHTVTLDVTDGNSTCIKADLNASFSIAYNSTSGTSLALFALPDSTAVSGDSSCGNPPRLVASFGPGHRLSLVFASDESLYSVSGVSLQYNLSDADTFPQAVSSGLASVETNDTGIRARRNSTYRCLSSSPLSLGAVNVTFSDLRLEAYMTAANFSADESVCRADQAATTVTPTSAPRTSPAPTPPPATPERINYTLTSRSGEACLLALMGLQLNLTYFSPSRNRSMSEVQNLQQNKTSFSGSCGSTVSTLQLTAAETLTSLNFTFVLNLTTQRFHLSSVSLSATWPDMEGPFSASNSSLSYLQGDAGRSYSCSAEQVLLVDPTFSINTFQMQIQPFNVTSNQFAAAQECRVDEENMLIPIIVGAALAGLVLIVLVAYLIGRKRTYAGYQTI